METNRYEIKFGVEKEERLDIADDSPKQHGLTVRDVVRGGTERALALDCQLLCQIFIK